MNNRRHISDDMNDKVSNPTVNIRICTDKTANRFDIWSYCTDVFRHCTIDIPLCRYETSDCTHKTSYDFDIS